MIDPNLGSSGMFDNEPLNGIKPPPDNIDIGVIVLTTTQINGVHEWDNNWEIEIGNTI